MPRSYIILLCFPFLHTWPITYISDSSRPLNEVPWPVCWAFPCPWRSCCSWYIALYCYWRWNQTRFPSPLVDHQIISPTSSCQMMEDVSWRYSHFHQCFASRKISKSSFLWSLRLSQNTLLRIWLDIVIRFPIHQFWPLNSSMENIDPIVMGYCLVFIWFRQFDRPIVCCASNYFLRNRPYCQPNGVIAGFLRWYQIL